MESAQALRPGGPRRQSLRPGRGVAAALCLIAAGCGRGPESGEHGRLSFRWLLVDAPGPRDFRLAMARGFRMDVAVERGGARVPVTSAVPRDRSLLAVTNVREDAFTIEAQRPSNSLVDVSAGGVADAASFIVVELKRVRLDPPAATGRAPYERFAFLRGGTALFGMQLLGLDDRPLVGWGTVPVTITPPRTATALLSVMTDHLAVQFDDYGHAVIAPLGSPSLSGDVVDPSHITGLSLAALGPVSSISQAAGAPVVHLVLEAKLDDGRDGVGLDGLAMVESRNPSVCGVAIAPVMGNGVYAVRAVAPGSCLVVANIGTMAARSMISIIP